MTHSIGQNPTFTVSEFVAVFNQSLEMIYPLVSISGEISNFRVSKGKWVSFDLKDDFSSVKFFGNVYALPGPLEDGITCEVFGRPRLHNQFGFSVNFEQIRPLGEGSIRKAHDLLLKKLQAEGLFAEERKRRLPYPPTRIGLITSVESAAIADFKKIVSARWPVIQIELIDTLVQGAQAPAEIIKAINKFNMMSSPPEVLVLIRGGGSTDDLAVFSEEAVVRAVAASRLPTLVAIGHENDISLAELAADMRASTPSNAAELLVPDIKHETVIAKSAKENLDRLLQAQFKEEIEYASEARNNMQLVIQSICMRTYNYILSTRALLQVLDPQTPLRLGYALVRTDKGKHIKRASQMTEGHLFSLEFTDGKKRIRVDSSE